METYFKIVAGIMVTMTLCLLLPKQKSDVSVLLCIAVCAMALLCIAHYVQPLINFFTRLIRLSDIPEDMLQALFKTVGIGLLSQVSTVLCIDAGNLSLAKVLQIITTAVILWLCIPMLEQLLDLIVSLLGVA